MVIDPNARKPPAPPAFRLRRQERAEDGRRAGRGIAVIVVVAVIAVAVAVVAVVAVIAGLTRTSNGIPSRQRSDASGEAAAGCAAGCEARVQRSKASGRTLAASATLRRKPFTRFMTTLSASRGFPLFMHMT